MGMPLWQVTWLAPANEDRGEITKVITFNTESAAKRFAESVYETHVKDQLYPIDITVSRIEQYFFCEA